MAPMPLDEPMSLKRKATTTDFNAPVAKRQAGSHHHRFAWVSTKADRHQVAPLDEPSVDALLERTIALALEAVGFAGAQNGIIDAFRVEVEEYMLHLFGGVRQSMLNSKRTIPIPHDFLQSLHSHQLSLRSLIPHLGPPIAAENSRITLPADEALQVLHDQQPSLDIFMGGSSKEYVRAYIPSHLPPFPSEHTFKATPDLPIVKSDPRKVRELATEEARLGEAALRKLVGAISDMKTATPARSEMGVQSMRAKRDEAWREAMRSLSPVTNSKEDGSDQLQDLEMGGIDTGIRSTPAPANGYLSSSVDAEKQYWRRPGTRRPVKDPNKSMQT